MFDNYYISKINIDNTSERNEVDIFLSEIGLTLEPDVEYTAVIRNNQSQIIATGSLSNNILKCIGVSSSIRGTGLSSKIITHLISIANELGRDLLFVFTSPDNTSIFIELGFRHLADVKPYYSLLEFGIGGIEDYQDYLKSRRISQEIQNAGTIIVNCNPFTLGHRYLIETALSMCEHLYIIVVETDLSVFPFDIRYQLIEKGTSDLPNTTMIKGGKYVISNITFPTYFLKEINTTKLSVAQTKLDVTIFAKYIAKVLNIKKRFVGTEPYCKTTNTYNKAMNEILPEYNIELVEIERKTFDETPISATHVRNALKNRDFERIQKLVPKTTFEYLTSQKAVPIIEKLKFT